MTSPPDVSNFSDASQILDVGNLMSVAQQNFFEIFELQPMFELDQRELKKKYRHLQLILHPDQQVAATEQERLKAVQLSSIVNDAFEVLRKPLKRARYLLELAGVDLHKDRAIEPSILMEQLELREHFDELKQSLEPEGLVEKLAVQLAESLSEASRRFSQQSERFFELAQEADKSQVLQAMRQTLSRMLFLNKLLEDVEGFLAS